ncbi:hypothetical protein [Streptomyces bohaiensis]|uniref:Lipoprotein n=1 Tax=Streptomyces bohaiensis TaxID=1431344 RepID=A0ABX1C801_9ACTN|nr:hypothetical protein [Streptomyces bohaiensis]NJQ14090.1 hypothetical protein [Streptomyces bohaiensis]
MCHRSTALAIALAAVALSGCTTVQPLPSQSPAGSSPRPAAEAVPAIPVPDPIEETTPVLEEAREERPVPPTPARPPTAPESEPEPTTTRSPLPAPARPLPGNPDADAPAGSVPPAVGLDPGAVCDMGQGWLDADLATACREAFGGR